MRSEVLDRAIKKAGGVNALAKDLNVTPQAISQWDEVPPLKVLAVEIASGIPRHELRPDIYPPSDAPGAPAAPSAAEPTPEKVA